MDTITIANICYEWEIEQGSLDSLYLILCKHPIFMQLQYLSFLYAQKEDIVVCTHHPEPHFLHRLSSLGIKREYALLSSADMKAKKMDFWGPSPSVAQWAEKRGIPVLMPPWNCIKEVNSKIFSFSQSPLLKHAALIQDKGEALKWIQSFQGTKVFKSAYGLSGNGHRIIDGELDNKTLQFLERQWKNKLPVIAEPWVDRLLDFSTQWFITQDKQIEYLGATICHNNARGAYQKSEILPDHDIGSRYAYFLERHKETALALLSAIALKGYFGNVGIDAMLYGTPSAVKLHPIVEINARKTMGWVALTMQKKFFPSKTLTASYTNAKKEDNFLPNYVLTHEQQIMPFTRSLCFDVH